MVNLHPNFNYRSSLFLSTLPLKSSTATIVLLLLLIPLNKTPSLQHTLHPPPHSNYHLLPMADSNTSSTQTSSHSSVKDDRICLDSGKRGTSKVEFSEDEETLITRMYKLVGKRWSLIAGRIPGRTAEEIEKYWTSKLSSSSK
ncbi:hypothetical protein ACSQ67_010616 [Phaseolus vulgaris]